MQDQHIVEIADRIGESGDLPRTVEQGGELPVECDDLSFALTDERTVIFAGLDFHPLPLHAIDSDHTVEVAKRVIFLLTGEHRSDES